MSSKDPGISHWISEAIVDFLRGPLYIHPLMGFIDEKCTIFTPEEENKIEYTIIHNEFKELVDSLLTEFLEDLGVTAEAFYEVVAADHNKDKLTGFVVQTILTVDDFLMFKAMMVKRNLDLTQQVLAAVDELRAAAIAHEEAGGKLNEEDLEQTVQLSKSVNEQESRAQALQSLMRSLQLQDEDVALAIAIAESLKDMARSQSELAELEQAIALSLALEAEQRRLAAACAAGELAHMKLGDEAGSAGQGATRAAPGMAAPTAASAGSGAKAVSQQDLLFRPFPEPRPMDLGPLPQLGHVRGAPRGGAPLSPLDPLNIGPNTGADKLSAVAAAAAQAANMVGASASEHPTPIHSDVGVSRSQAWGEDRGSSGRFVPAPLHVSDKPGGTSPSAAGPREKFVPAPLNLPDKPRRVTGDVPSPESLIMGGVRGIATQSSVRNRAAGYRGEGSGPQDMTALREAAAAAAATQKSMLAAKKANGEGGDDAVAQAWLNDAKAKLVAQKKAEREAEMAAYRAAGKGPAGMGSKGLVRSGKDDEMEAKRAALRDKLASKMKQDLMGAP